MSRCLPYTKEQNELILNTCIGQTKITEALISLLPKIPGKTLKGLRSHYRYLRELRNEEICIAAKIPMKERLHLIETMENVEQKKGFRKQELLARPTFFNDRNDLLKRMMAGR